MFNNPRFKGKSKRGKRVYFVLCFYCAFLKQFGYNCYPVCGFFTLFFADIACCVISVLHHVVNADYLCMLDCWSFG